MSIFILTAVIVLIFFPLIYFMWSSFISMLFWQWKLRNMSDEEKENLMMGPYGGLPVREEPRHPKQRVTTGLFNFVTADEFIRDLDRPGTSTRRLRHILDELASNQGLIKREQHAALRQRLLALKERLAAEGKHELVAPVDQALAKLDEATFID